MRKLYASLAAEYQITAKGLIIAFLAGCAAAILCCYLIF